MGSYKRAKIDFCSVSSCFRRNSELDVTLGAFFAFKKTSVFWILILSFGYFLSFSLKYVPPLGKGMFSLKSYYFHTKTLV